jgi:hypothetical protein
LSWDAVPDAIEGIRFHLGLGYGEIGRMFGVPGQTVRAWATGEMATPEEYAARISEAHGALLRLLRLVRPDRLAQVVRRPAEAFGGRCALDLIVEGRIAEVAETFEAILEYWR